MINGKEFFHINFLPSKLWSGMSEKVSEQEVESFFPWPEPGSRKKIDIFISI